MWGSDAARVDVVNSNEVEWVQAHRELSRLARQRAGLDAEEGRWLVAALRSAADVHLGYGSFSEYIECLFGYRPRWTQEKLRVAEALEELPHIAAALERGQLNWSAARELTRVAVGHTEHEWLAAAAGKSVRQLEQLIAGANPGDLPTTPRDTSACPRVLRFEVTPETYAFFREALSQLRRRTHTRVEDDALLLEMARAVLGGPRDEGRSSYQVALTLCPECGHGGQIANGELVTVGPEVTELARCDAQELGELMRAANDTTEQRTTRPNECAHVGAPTSHTTTRAKQSIPPAVRRTVLRRDQKHCRVPGCRNATFLDVHHIVPRTESGRNDAANLITLCGAHHRAVHRDELVVEGQAHGEIRFRHADGAGYGASVAPEVANNFSKVSTALRNLGFREPDVRAALAKLRDLPDLRMATAERLLREGVLSLTSKAV